MKIGYARVSTDEQSLDKQIDMLSAEGISNRCIYKEKMTETSKERPELVRMLEEIENGGRNCHLRPDQNFSQHERSPFNNR